jgi:two-component system NtrC family sensor kinase
MSDTKEDPGSRRIETPLPESAGGGAPSPAPLPCDGLHDVPFRHRLGPRLAFAVSFVSLGIMGLLILIGLRAQENRLVGEVVQGAILFGDTIRSSTRDHMLKGEKPAAYQIMERIGELPGIEKVRIFNKEGKITYSTAKGEIGSLVDKKAESCYACHAAGQPLQRLTVPSRTRIFTEKEGHRVLGIVTPIYNEAACSEADCHVHGREKQVLGVVDVGMSLEAIDSGLAQFRRDAVVVAAIGAFLLALFVLAVTRRFVLRPVQKLVVATSRLASGDLDHQVTAQSCDEVGHLARSFDEMRLSLVRTRGELSTVLEGLERQVEERTAALRSAQTQLVQGEKLSSLGRLSASIAHEINNPLAGILTFTKLLIRSFEEGAVDEKKREGAIRQLRLVQRETERCSEIVRNLLDFARQRPVAPREVDLVPALEESLSLVGHQIDLQGIVLERKVAGPALVRADFGQLRQAFVNILLNSCGAMQQGGHLLVALRADETDRFAEVTIRDTGVGISETDLPRIFDPFFTTKEKGTGLGLSVVYGIIEHLGGKLTIESKVGQGTTVRIRVPLAASPAVSA